MTPVLWGRKSSVNVQKVMWALAECDIPHERIDAGFTYGHTDTEAFAAMNPMRQVPVWQEDDLSLWESHVILRHLARGPAAALWPETRADQALADLWMEFTTTTLLPPMIGVFFQTVRHRPEDRSRDLLAKHLGDLDVAMDVLEARLSGRNWLVGDRVTLAEMTAGTAMFRFHHMDIPRKERPGVQAWYERMCARPAYQATAMASYEELRQG